MKPKYKRILLKLSGEALMDPQAQFGISLPVIQNLGEEIKEIKNLGVEIAIVLGGGNIFRGTSPEAESMDRATADTMGMMATVINSLSLQDALEKKGIHTRVLSAIAMQQVAEPYIRRRAIRHLEKGRVIIFAAGTGNPYFSTDTAASLRAQEVHAEVILKGTKVDGIFDSDPKKNKSAKLFESVTYIDVLKKNLKVMDATAITMCRENKTPIIVFNLFKKGNLRDIVLGKKIGTVVHGSDSE